MKLCFSVFLLAGVVFAQDATTLPGSAASVSAVPTVPMNAAEKLFADSMNNVKMIGFFTVGDSKELHDDAYVIEKIAKVADGQWNFSARIQYGGRDVKVTLKIPVQFAGDTPVINFIRQTVQGMGTYDARVLFYKGGYAGTWGAGDHGGTMFGKIVKIDAMPQDTPAKLK
jgi:hypothetical protein